MFSVTDRDAYIYYSGVTKVRLFFSLPFFCKHITYIYIRCWPCILLMRLLDTPPGKEIECAPMTVI